jgi:hypothetical protein
MAGCAGLGVKLMDISGMACLAVQRLPLVVFCVMDQRKAGLWGVIERSAIQNGRFPACRWVTIVAGLVKGALMDIGICMAMTALRWCIFEIWPFMTPRTAYLDMRPWEWETAILMVKPDQAVFPIVTIQAIITEILEVSAHQSRVVPGMAIKAGIFLYRISYIIRVMARAAIHPGSIIIDNVVDQAEADFRMVEFVKSRHRHIKWATTVVWMAGCTL